MPVPTGERRARAALTQLPPDPDRTSAVHTDGAEAVWASLHADVDLDPDGLLATHTVRGWRLLCPGDDEWPTTLTPTDRTPIGMWVHGEGHLGDLTARSVTLTGTRSPSPHGADHAERLAVGLVTAAPPVTVTGVVSMGIGLRAVTSAAPHGPTIALLASPTPAALTRYRGLFTTVAARGVVLATAPPLAAADPDAGGYYRRCEARTALLATMTPALFVVESETAGQAMTLARTAHDWGRLVMALPPAQRLTVHGHGGCHQLLRGGLAVPAVTVDDITARLPTG